MDTPSATAELIADFSSISVGDHVSITRTIAEADVTAFARLSGDYNPLHMDSEFAQTTHFQKRVVHGMVVASLVSTLIGMHLPGPGALWAQQSFNWVQPVFIGDTLTVTLRVTHKSEGTRTVAVTVEALNQHGKIVMNGTGTVLLLEQREKETPRTSLSDRVAFVTGGSRGIGAATASALARAGASVVVNYRQSKDAAERLCEQLRADGAHAFAAGADVRDELAVASAMDWTSDRFGRPVDILINNAIAPAAAQAFLGTDWTAIQSVFDVQVRGAFQCARAVLPKMIERKSGYIINVGSLMAAGSPAQQAALGIAKAAMKALTRSLAAEFGPQGVRVNMVSPGLTETESTAEVPERLRKLQAMQTPLRRLCRPEDVAQTILFLCSGGGDFITGADVPVGGGWGL
ncbi:MAG: SDR family oxidoreductase [Bryobacterales bacterium]|nr:SDR family oxidoreductase [Bryobacterales bacterium]